MEKCFQEAVRYLGYGKNPVDEATSRLVEKGFFGAGKSIGASLGVSYF